MKRILSNISYTGQEIDDYQSFARLPDYLKDFLSCQNGFIAFNGGFHVRGCVLTPKWHSLGDAWYGDLKLSDLFVNLTTDDIPIAQDCFGDQYLIRNDEVIRLLSETGELEYLKTDFHNFMDLIADDPFGVLNIDGIERFDLKPGQLLSVFPPFCINTNSEYSIKPIDSYDRIRFLSHLSRQISNLPDGTDVKMVVK